MRRSVDMNALYFLRNAFLQATESYRENEASKHCSVIPHGRCGSFFGPGFLCSGW